MVPSQPGTEPPVKAENKFRRIIAIVISFNLLNRQIPLVSGGPTFLSGKI
jgi:hypothetical protein